MVIILFMWVAFAIASYFVNRAYFRHGPYGSWTVGSRRMAVIASVLGPFAVIGAICAYAMLVITSDDTEARW